jgi:peroxiredoxin
MVTTYLKPMGYDVTSVYTGTDGLERFIAERGRDVPSYQGNASWMFPIPATFVVGRDGLVTARFVDPDYRKRMVIEDMLQALRAAR